MALALGDLGGLSRVSVSSQGSTIFALATPAGRGALAVMRISGPQSGTVLAAISRRELPPPRQAALRRLRGAGGELLDEALVLWMPGPGSFTGEDSAELHLHGSSAVVSAVSDELAAIGLRLAGPGEFTRRAFENGRLDLAQAEAIADLIEAESGAQMRQALDQLGGALSLHYETWRENLLDTLALLEAELDFPDDGTPQDVAPLALPRLRQVLANMQRAVGDLRGERVREGFRVAIIGAPNVGKSSLLNALAGRDAAIVTDVAGTTRDVVEVTIGLVGQTLILADTAGLRETTDVIEAQGVCRATAYAERADLRIGVVDFTRPDTLAEVSSMLADDDLLVFNKSDLSGPAKVLGPAGNRQSVRAAAGRGEVPDVRNALIRWLQVHAAGREFPASTRRRHRLLIQEGVAHLTRASDDPHRGVELVAEDVRLAIRTLERITGQTDPEAVLDRVFSSFCIGK